MSTGQWRVLGLLAFLLLLEIIRSPILQAFFKGILQSPIQAGVTTVAHAKNVVKPNTNTSSTSTSTSTAKGNTTTQQTINQLINKNA